MARASLESLVEVPEKCPVQASATTRSTRCGHSLSSG